MKLGHKSPYTAMRGWFRIAAAAILMQLAVTGCSAPQRLGAVPESATTKADPGLGPIRFMAKSDPASFAEEARNSYTKEQAWLASQGHVGPLPPVNFLAISGGGDNGAFGAGLLTAGPPAEPVRSSRS